MDKIKKNTVIKVKNLKTEFFSNLIYQKHKSYLYLQIETGLNLSLQKAVRSNLAVKKRLNSIIFKKARLLPSTLKLRRTSRQAHQPQFKIL